MPRYINRNKFMQILEADKWGFTDTVKIGVALDKAEEDVVPKSEVKETVEKLMSATDKVICEAKQEVARKIFEEIEEEIAEALKSNYRVLEEYDDGRCNEYILELVNRVKGKIDALRGIDYFIDELKKKYMEGEE